MRDLISQLPAVVYEYWIYPDGKRSFEYVSESSEKILGVSSVDIMKDAGLLDRIVHPDDAPNMRQTSRASEIAADEWYWQGRMVVGNDTKLIEVRSNYEKRADGVVVRRGIIQDITRRRETQKESERRYQSLVELLPIAVVIQDDKKVLYANTQAQNTLRTESMSDIVGGDLLRFLDPESMHPVEHLDQRRNSDAAGMMELKCRRGDGKLIDVEVMAFPYEYRGEASIQIVFIDISERKTTETRTKKNETLLTQLFQNIPMAVVLLSDAGKVEQVNKGFEEMFGYTLSELRNNSINDFIVPEQLVHEGVDLNNLIASHRVVSIETVRRHRNGKIVDVILYGMPVKLDNQTIGIYGVYIDITERKRVEEELKIRNAELDNFVYKVSHDLRAPLSSILGLVNLAKLPGNTDNPMDYIEIIGSKVEHLDHFIGDVLSHSKNLKMDVSVSKVDFGHIIDETFNDLNYLEGAKGLSRHIKIDGIDFYNDPWRIAEILRNLISNAIKYRKLDEPHSEIAIRINVDHLRAEITFADNGIGIEEKNLARVFEMFYRATEQSDGSGIGLYIVKNAVDKIGGQISVASLLSEGTRFTIILPNRINSAINQLPTSVGVEQQ
jgi:PAS domain S-box-containing protein